MNDGLILVKLLSDECRSYDILLIVCEIGKETNAFEALSILIVISDDDFLYSFSEGLPVNQPQTHRFLGFNRTSSLRIIQ